MPPVTLLDAAARHGLRVMVGLSAEQYVGHLADPRGAPDVEAIVREKVRSVAGHPALLCYASADSIEGYAREQAAAAGVSTAAVSDLPRCWCRTRRPRPRRWRRPPRMPPGACRGACR